MKKLNLLTILIMLAFTSVSFGQITGSAHDFSGESWNSNGQICQVCHTPHNADISVSNSPLWNHAVTGETFIPYSTSTLTANVGQPSNHSKLCLSCHDGVTALDNFGNNTSGTTTIGAVNGNLGTSLMNDHPISFTYDATLATTDKGLHDPTTTNSGLGSTITNDMLTGGNMECSSCHDVHNGSGFGKLLLKGNGMSALCLTCHDK